MQKWWMSNKIWKHILMVLPTHFFHYSLVWCFLKKLLLFLKGFISTDQDFYSTTHVFTPTFSTGGLCPLPPHGPWGTGHSLCPSDVPGPAVGPAPFRYDSTTDSACCTVSKIEDTTPKDCFTNYFSLSALDWWPEPPMTFLTM